MNHDLTRYHVATDEGVIEAHRIDEDDLTVGPAVAKEVGEIGIVGTAAVIANAVHDAISVRVRDLSIRRDSCSGDRCSPSSLAAGIST